MILPRSESDIIVEKEYLEIRFRKLPVKWAGVAYHSGLPGMEPFRVHVLAVYTLHNPEKTDRQLDLAFPILRNSPVEYIDTVVT